MKTKFPFKLCKKGCDIDFAIHHTLEWREKFKPWLMTPSAFKENEKGWIYYRGFSPNPFVDDDRKAGHGMIWYRPGIKKIGDTEAYGRTIVNAVDTAIADSLVRTNNRVGKINILLDCKGFGISYIPRLSDLIRLITILQDHYPDKFGMLIIAHLQGASGLVLKMAMPLLPEAVRYKIRILPNDEEKALNLLKVMIVEEFIPDWLGGVDDYRFDANSYYDPDGSGKRFFSDEEGKQYLTTMPYHG